MIVRALLISLRGLLEIVDQGSGIQNRRSGIDDRFFEKLKSKINESWWRCGPQAVDKLHRTKPRSLYWALNLSKLLRVWLTQWLFWRESEIFLENETLYPSDGYDQEIMSCSSFSLVMITCMLCTALNIVLWDRVNTNCTEILNADAKQLMEIILIKTIVQFFERKIHERVLLTGPISICTLWHITHDWYSKRKSNITAPANNKTHLQASETQRYYEHSWSLRPHSFQSNDCNYFYVRTRDTFISFLFCFLFLAKTESLAVGQTQLKL